MAQTALDDLIAIYKEAQLALIKIITGNTGAGTKTYYNTILKQTEALLNRLSAQTGRYIRAEIPKEYKAALDQTYDYFKRNNLRMKRPESFAQVHSDAVSELAAEMQHHINEGISSAGRRVMRYADTARDNALRQNGLRASAVKIASGQTVRDMQKDLTQRLSEDGFLTVQYGSGKYAYQVGLDSYAAMVARSTTREAGNLAREKQLTANGYDLVIITEHKPCCEMCARVQGRVFSISGNDKRFPPLSAAFTSGYRNVHPNCSCVAVPWIEELQSPEELRHALEKGSQPLKDERSDAEKALYTQQQSDSRKMRSDLIQYERYKARLGSDAPKSFSAFRRMKNAGGDRWEALQKEYRQRFEKVAEERRELLSRDKVDIAKNAKTTKMAEKASVVESWEAENYKNSTEKGLLILPDGTTKDFGGIEHHVTGKEDDIKLMNGATFTHNHPTDNTFSQNDIVTGIVKGNLKEMRAVTSTGDVHILANNGATEQQRRKFNVDYQQRRMKAANAADAKIRRGEKINKDEYVKERLERFMSEHAEEYNLSYTKSHIIDNLEDEIDFKKLANIATGKSYKNTVDEFVEHLPDIQNKDVSTVLKRTNRNVSYSKSHRRNSFFNKEENTVYLDKSATPSTVAHELFHKIDHDNNISLGGMLDKCISNDYEQLIKSAENAGQSIEDMLYLKYPKAFEEKGRVKVEYRGISDIISGMTGDKINLGYHHNADYWKKPFKLQKEAFAQYGRMYFEENDDVLKMLHEILPETTIQVNNVVSAISRFGR